VRTGERTGWVLEPSSLHRTVDGGSSWKSTPIPGVDGRRFGQGQLFVDGPTAWVVTRSDADGVVSVTRVSEGTGASTASLPGTHPGVSSASVAFVDADHGWAAVGVDRGSQEVGSDLYATTDGGQTWRELGPAPFDGPLHPVDRNLGFALGSTFWRTEDGGASWREENPPHPDTGLPTSFARLSLFGSRGVLQVNVPTGMMGYALFDVTEDGGTTWEARRAPREAGFNNTGPPLTFSVTDPDRWHVMQGRRLWATTDGGRSWEEIQTDLTEGSVRELSFASFDRAWAVLATGSCAFVPCEPGNERIVLATDDGGRHWRHLSR